MPNGAPIPKENATRAYGADVEFVGTTIDECLVRAKEFEAETGAVLIHPFDHVDIVAGQGTCGLEILEQCPDVKTVIVPLGGGGFLAGIATAIKAQRPDVRVIGVQAEAAAAYPGSLAAGKPVPLGKMATMADGIAVGCPGDVPFAAVQTQVDEVRTVSEEALSTALLALIERAKVVVEPAGAAAVAALMDAPHDFEGPIVVGALGRQHRPDPDDAGDPARHGRPGSLPVDRLPDPRQARWPRARCSPSSAGSRPTCSTSSTSGSRSRCPSTRSRSPSRWRCAAKPTARRCIAHLRELRLRRPGLLAALRAPEAAFQAGLSVAAESCAERLFQRLLLPLLRPRD